MHMNPQWGKRHILYLYPTQKVEASVLCYAVLCQML